MTDASVHPFASFIGPKPCPRCGQEQCRCETPPPLPYDEEEWPAPVPLSSTPPLPTFPVRSLPRWLRDHVEAVAEFAQVPVDLPASMGLASLAAAAGGRAVVEVRRDWREPTNLFVVAVMPPGSRKSAVMRHMTQPLMTAEKSMIEDTASEISEAKTLREVAEREAQEARAQAARASDSDKRNELRAEAIEKARMAEAITVPVPPRLLADDVTPEAAASLLAEQRGRLAVMSAEGGIFQILGGRYSQSGPSLEVFLKGHAGDDLRIDRKGRDPEHVEHPALTLGLTVQPDVLRTIARMPGFRGRGLLARILYSVPENTVGRRKVGTDPIPEHVSATYKKNLQALVLSLAEWTDPAVLTLTEEAAEFILEAERQLEPRLHPETGDLGHMADWGAKLIGATARIAGLLHLATNLTDGWGRPIEASTMADAIEVGRYFAVQAQGAYFTMGVDPLVEDARDVGVWIAQRETFTKRQLHHAFQSRFTKARDVDPVLELLDELGWIRRLPEPPREGGGRPPSPAFQVHPRLTERTQRTQPAWAGGSVGSVSSVRGIDDAS